MLGSTLRSPYLGNLPINARFLGLSFQGLGAQNMLCAIPSFPILGSKSWVSGHLGFVLGLCEGNVADIIQTPATLPTQRPDPNLKP